MAACGSGPHLVVHGEDELAEARDRLLHRVEVGRRLAAAEVGERPRRVPQQGELGVGGEEVDDGRHAVGGVEHGVAECRGVAGDVAERPDGLLADVLVRGAEELDELGKRGVEGKEGKKESRST